MPAAHYALWERHLLDFPAGDMLTQRLMAELIMTVEAFMCGFAGKNSKPRTLEQVAPWLYTEAMRKQADSKKQATLRKSAMSIIQAQEEQ